MLCDNDRGGSIYISFSRSGRKASVSLEKLKLEAMDDFPRAKVTISMLLYMWTHNDNKHLIWLYYTQVDTHNLCVQGWAIAADPAADQKQATTQTLKGKAPVPVLSRQLMIT